MQGFDLNTQRQVTKKTPFVHYSDENVEIRSAHDINSILNVPVVNTILPGNLSSYIYPEGSVIYFKKKIKFKDLLNEYERNATNKRNNLEASIFDVLPQEEDIHEEELEEEEFEEEDDDDDDENEGEEELWEEEDEEAEDIEEVPED